MPLAARMDKMVSFRLSDEEYEQFIEICRTTRARSVSEVARTAMHYWLEHASDDNGRDLPEKVRELEERLGELSAEVKMLRQRG